MDNHCESLLFDQRYIRFLATSHPHLALRLGPTGAPCYVANLACLEVLTPSLASLATQLKPLIPRAFKNPRALVFGLPFEPYEQTPILDALPDVATMRVMAAIDHADVVLLTNLNPKSESFHKLVRKGFYAMPSFPDMIITLSATSFEDYLHARSRKHRQRIKEKIRIFDGASHAVRPVTSIEPSLGRSCFDAYLAMYHRAKVPWLRYEEEYFHGFLHHVPNAFLKVAYGACDDFLGMVQGMREGDRLHITRLGVHSDYYRKDAVLFRLFYTAIETALLHQCRTVSLGPTAYRVKRRMGANHENLANLILPTSTLWKATMRFGGQWSFPHLLSHLTDKQAMEKHF